MIHVYRLLNKVSVTLVQESIVAACVVWIYWIVLIVRNAS